MSTVPLQLEKAITEVNNSNRLLQEEVKTNQVPPELEKAAEKVGQEIKNLNALTGSTGGGRRRRRRTRNRRTRNRRTKNKRSRRNRRNRRTRRN